MFKRLVISFLLLVMSVILLITVSFAQYSDDVLSQDILDAYNKSAESIASQCNNYVNDMQRNLLTLAVNALLQTAMRDFEPGSTIDFSALNYPGWSFRYNVYPFSDGVLYFPDETGRYASDPAQAQQQWVADTVEKNGKLSLSAVTIDGLRYIRFSMLVTDTGSWQSPLGIIIADVQMDSFVVSIGKTSMGSSDYMVLTDYDGALQYPYQSTSFISTEKVRAAIEKGSYAEADRIFFCFPISRPSWHLVLSFSTSNIQARTNTLYQYGATIAVASALIACIIALFISYRHTLPITSLARHMKDDTLQLIDIPPDLNRDYLALYASYNEMVGQITDLLGELYESNKRERETQLKMLQAQLNPHFIYNVLDSVNWLAIKYKVKDIQRMVSALATMLRCSLNGGRDILCVEHEVQQIQSYLDIQSYRYDDRIHVTYDFSPEIMDKKMIKLLLQPLVENSIVHGLETYGGEKKLRLSGRLESGMLIFEVANNGNRPDIDRINQILDGSQIVTTSYGIRNVDERIKAAYGDQYGLRYYTDGCWNVVNITVPCEPISE